MTNLNIALLNKLDSNIIKSEILLPDTIVKISNERDSTICITEDNTTETINAAEKRIDNLKNTPWLSSALIVLLICLLYIIGKHKKNYIFSARNLLSSKNRSVFYDDDSQSRLSSVMLWGINIISLTLFMIIGVMPMESAIKILRNPIDISIIFSMISLFIISKYFGFKILGYIFEERKNMYIYSDSYFTIICILGITLIPISICAIYSPLHIQSIMITIGYIIGAISFILIMFKSIQIFFHKYTSLLYIFLYLCALEILPIFLLLKVVICFR